MFLVQSLDVSVGVYQYVHGEMVRLAINILMTSFETRLSYYIRKFLIYLRWFALGLEMYSTLVTAAIVL